MLLGLCTWHSMVSVHHSLWMSRNYGFYGSGFLDSRATTLQEGLNAVGDLPLSPHVRTWCLASQFGSNGSDQVGAGFGQAGSEASQLKFCLHDLMDAAGLDTIHARAARADFEAEIKKLKSATDDRGSSSSSDLARAALGIAAEDDALVSHSCVPLPVDSYMERLDGMATEFAGHHLPKQDRSPSAVFHALDNYMYVYQSFRRSSATSIADARDSYLNSVLTRKVGTPVMLALIYSELVKRLCASGATDFLAEVELPGDPVGLPRAHAASQYLLKRAELPSAEPPHPVLLTPQLLLVEVLRALKQLFWPWKSLSSPVHSSEFLEAATAASRGTRKDALSPLESLFAAPSSSKGADIASARAAQLRLQRGIWTSSSFGDIRRALAASERLVLLGLDVHEQRDYGMLLFHCGLYQDAYAYLTAYSTSEMFTRSPTSYNELAAKEHAAVGRLLERLQLILLERSWEVRSNQATPKDLPPDPW